MNRRTIDLHRLPMWVQYGIAVIVSALIAFLAWHVGHDKPKPVWLSPVMAVWLWLGPALLAFFVINALLKWARRCVPPQETEKLQRRDA